VPDIGLISRDGSAIADAARAEAAAWLAERGQRTVALTRESGPDALTGLSLILAFGGDGTLLGAAHAVALAGLDIPVLGVNLGHLGFLTEVSRAEMLDALGAVLEGRTRTETRLMLHGRLERNGQTVAERLALNDIVVTRGALSRMIEVDVSVDDLPVTHIKADGVIIATATGSTAYNLSAGGPIVLPSVDAMVLTPIAPHALSNRPLVLPATATVVLKPVIESQEDLVATFDGQFGLDLQTGDAIVVTRATRVVKLLRVTNRSHFDMLREKLRWG
jgi:NAD+ kinase